MHRNTGACYLGNDKCEFSVWAPFRESVKLEIADREPQEMEKDKHGYWSATLEGVAPETKYRFILDDDLKRPDPASRDQSEGVHDWSKVKATDNFRWTDYEWEVFPLKDFLIYELHVGTFTPEGTYEGIINKLDYLLELGINTIEIMPIAQFPGSRNWGYDGVYPYAAQDSYGGREGLKKLVNACHRKGIAVVLDVVYNHMGPEGNYLRDFGPYFTEKYNTPWGAAINFDDEYSDQVRAFFIHSAMKWLDEFHIDALRLDAVHAIFDNSAKHFLRELREKADNCQQETGRQFYLIAESDMNDVKLLKPYERGGYNLDAQWADDFHHSIHTLATGETKGYYADYGKVENLAKTFRQAFVYDGEYSEYRKRRIGSDPSEQTKENFVVCIQNHDQVGNRMLGERLSHIISHELYKTCAGILLMSPYVPLLFMGEEYGEKNPFQYFVSHGDPDLVKAVQKGRAEEFKSFKWQGEVPDPQSEETFNRSKLQWNFEENSEQQALFEYYKYLISLRKKGAFAAFANRSVQTDVDEEHKLLILIGKNEETDDNALFAAINFNEKDQKIKAPESAGGWQKVFATTDQKWNGSGGSEEKIEKEEELELKGESLIVYKAI